MADGVGKPRLELRTVASLYPHEETIEARTREMSAELARDGVQKDPIIVDAATGVVLDGMHRLSALLRLRIAYAACDLVEYDSLSISVERWARVYRPAASGEGLEAFASVGLAEKHPRTEGMALLRRGEVPLAAFARDCAFLPVRGSSMEDAFRMVRKIDSLSDSYGWERSFVGEEQLDSRSMSGTEIALMVRKLDKSDVRKAGLERHPFPCKTSRHVVDPRPVAVNVPLADLEKGESKTLHERLKQRAYTVLPPNSDYLGRRYKERLLLLSGR